MRVRRLSKISFRIWLWMVAKTICQRNQTRCWSRRRCPFSTRTTGQQHKKNRRCSESSLIFMSIARNMPSMTTEIKRGAYPSISHLRGHKLSQTSHRTPWWGARHATWTFMRKLSNIMSTVINLIRWRLVHLTTLFRMTRPPILHLKRIRPKNNKTIKFLTNNLKLGIIVIGIGIVISSTLCPNCRSTARIWGRTDPWTSNDVLASTTMD